MCTYVEAVKKNSPLINDAAVHRLRTTRNLRPNVGNTPKLAVALPRTRSLPDS